VLGSVGVCLKQDTQRVNPTKETARRAYHKQKRNETKNETVRIREVLYLSLCVGECRGMFELRDKGLTRPRRRRGEPNRKKKTKPNTKQLECERYYI